MAAALHVRSDYSADDLRRIARDSDDADQTRRLLALAAILDGVARWRLVDLAAGRLGALGA